MSNIRYYNQTGPFWDFIASMENTDWANHPLYRAWMTSNQTGNNQDEHDEPAAGAAGEHADRNMNTEAADPDDSVPEEFDPWSSGFPFAAGFPFGPGPGRGRGGHGHGHGRGRGGWGGPPRGPSEGPHGHHGHPRGRGPPPPPHPPGPDTDMPMPPPPHGGEHPPPPPPPPSGPHGHGHGHGDRDDHEHGHRGRGRHGSPGGRGRGGGGRGRGGRHCGQGQWGGQFNMNSLADFFQNQLFNDNNNNDTTTNINRSNVDSIDNTGANGDFTPPVDVFDTESSFIVDVSVPGAKKSDIAVSWDAEKSELSITGVVHRNGDEEFMKALALDERKVGAFARKVKLGSRANPATVDADGITAKLEEGVLRVFVPKEEKEFEVVHRIEVD